MDASSGEDDVLVACPSSDCGCFLRDGLGPIIDPWGVTHFGVIELDDVADLVTLQFDGRAVDVSLAQVQFSGEIGHDLFAQMRCCDRVDGPRGDGGRGIESLRNLDLRDGP